MNPTNFSSARCLAFVGVVALTLVASVASAQDAPPPGEPANPWTTAPSEPAPAPPPSSPTETPSAAAPSADTDADAESGIPPATPAPGLIYSSSQAEAAKERDQKRTDAVVEEPDDGKLRHHQDHWVASLGFRVSKVSSAGYDPFADSDELAQLSLGVGGALLTAGNFSLAGLFLYDVGGRSNDARGATSDLTVHRLSLGAEGRYHLIRQLFVFGRVAPGAIHSIAQLEDTSPGVENREARSWVFSTDLSGGAMFELTGFPGTSRKRRPNMWILLEGGYGFAAESDLSMTPYDGGGPERAQPIELGSLGLGGPFMRGALAITY